MIARNGAAARGWKAEPPPSLLSRWTGIALWKRVLLGLIAGVAIGLLAPHAVPYLGWVGTIFVRMIRMLVAPLVLVTIAAGVAALGDARRLGTLGGRAIALFALTAASAVCVGMTTGILIGPGIGADLSGAVAQDIGASKPLGEQLLGIVPVNIVKALADGDMLAIIFFALALGIGVLMAGKRAEPVAQMLQSLSDVLLVIVRIVMEFAPIGIFGLIAVAVAGNAASVFVNVGMLAICVVIASAVQSFLVHGLLIRLIARLPAWRFFRGSFDALVVAFSTASSAATLPVAMTVAERNLGIRSAVTSTVLPLGASIGRDGTALYVGLLAVFSAQVFGLQLGMAEYLLILVTATLVALGTAPVPSASLFMLAAVLSVLGVADAQTAMIVGFILPFDRLLDMIRTIPNATTNLTAATLVARWEGEIDTDVNRNRPPE